jgi:hypothetical protein
MVPLVKVYETIGWMAEICVRYRAEPVSAGCPVRLRQAEQCIDCELARGPASGGNTPVIRLAAVQQSAEVGRLGQQYE